MKNIFFNKLESLNFKEYIYILDLSKLGKKNFWEQIYPYNTNILNNILNYKEKIQIYKIKDLQCKKLILKLLILVDNHIEEYFIIKGSKRIMISDVFYIQFLITNKLISEPNITYLQHLSKIEKKDYIKMSQDYNLNINNNKEFFDKKEKDLIKNHKNHIMTIIYKYRYKKGTNGEKELVPIETVINKKLNCKSIISLLNHFNIDFNLNNYINNYLVFKRTKRTRIEKILYYIFKIHKNSYFNLLNDDLKLIICSFIN